ncbi:unnamed protein product [Cuscuta europaea]|uniref:Uncharacterized protein n=1 Tax=Cuscuta europaea TaxID=41803 RepID=A0A9P0Z5Y1_CUSEU|nr:unnamed protein product [Cuscuta europaea]
MQKRTKVFQWQFGMLHSQQIFQFSNSPQLFCLKQMCSCNSHFDLKLVDTPRGCCFHS